METETVNVKATDLKVLIKGVEEIKALLISQQNCPDPEGELSDWAKKELEEARETPETDYISMEEIEKEFL